MRTITRRSVNTVARILCVDDDAAILTLKRAILERAGHQVTTCAAAEDAVFLLERNSFDAVVTDWRLGEERGRAIVKAAKQHASVPVVVVSGFVAEAYQSAEPLADLYLEKPADPIELVQVLDALLGLKKEHL